MPPLDGDTTIPPESLSPGESTPTGDTGTPAAAQQTETPAPQAPQWDPAAFQTQYQNDQRQYVENYNAMLAQLKSQSQAHSEFQKKLLEAFAPEYAAKANQTKYVPEEQFRTMQEQMRRYMDEQVGGTRELIRFERGMEVAREKYPRVFEMYGEDEAREFIESRWGRSNLSVQDIAKQMDAALAKAFEKQQQAVIADKKQMQASIRGSGQKAGTPPPASAKHSDKRGLARLRALRDGTDG